VTSSNVDIWIPGGISYYAADFNNIAEVTPLFEEYRINWVQTDFLFAGAQSYMAEAYFATMPFRLLTCVDHDDDTAPTNNLTGWKSLLERHGARVDIVGARGSSKFSVRLQPKVLSEIYRSATTTAYSPIKAPFIDAEKLDVPHYGLKYCVMVPKSGSGAAGFPMRFDIVHTYNITFRGIH
jgi:hypothetical protein